jgi:hypothetical protein
MSSPEASRVTTETLPLNLVRMDSGYPANTVSSFTVGALSATAFCAFGYLLYTWFGS